LAKVEIITLPGLTPYKEAWSLQRKLLEGVVAKERPEALILCEHHPVVTLGRNASSEGLLVDESTLRARGVELFRVERGGEATLHLPGQLVAYPILSVRERRLGIRGYITALEETMIKVAESFGVKGYRIGGKPGVYSTAGKIGALGVALSRGVSYHGAALNISPDLSLFELIVPCGDREIPPSSLTSITGVTQRMGDVRAAFMKTFSDIFRH